MILLYVGSAIVALAIDRRALLVSALAYVLFALQSCSRQFGAVELSVALTALVIGSALLLPSAFWREGRTAGGEAAAGRPRQRLPIVNRSSVPTPAAIKPGFEGGQ